MADSRKRRKRKRLTIELDESDEVIVQRAREIAVRLRLSLRCYVLAALTVHVVEDSADDA